MSLIQDACLLVTWQGPDIIDDSALGMEFTKLGNPAVAGGVAALASGDGWRGECMIGDFTFITTGESWTVEFLAARPTSAEGTVVCMNESTSANRGLFVSIFADGRVKLLVGRGTSGTPLVDKTWPAGTISATGMHHIAIECSGFIDESGSGSVFWLAVDGIRVSGVTANTREGSQGWPFSQINIGQTPSGARALTGNLGPIRIMRGAVYDIKANATFTPPTSFPTSEPHAFAPFAARQMEARAGFNFVGPYSSEPKLAYLGDGHAVATFQNNDGHSGPGGQLVLLRSLNFGRKWAQPQVIGPRLGKDQEARNALLSRTSTGRLILTFHVRDYVLRTLRMFKQHSDDDGLTWSEPVPMTHLFSAAMQANGSGPNAYGRMVETSQGLALVAYANPIFAAPTTQVEVIFSTDDGDTWSAPSTIEIGTGRSNLLNETQLVVCDTPDKVVAISRSEDSGHKDRFFAFRSADGGLTWSYFGSAAWPIGTVVAPSPPEFLSLPDGRVMGAFVERGDVRCFYTVTDPADFYANPLRAYDGTEAKTVWHLKNNIGSPGEYGYPNIVSVGGDDVLIAHYEGFQQPASHKARLLVSGLSV